MSDEVSPASERQANYKKGFGWTLVFTVTTKLVTAVIGILVARWLSEEIFGLYTLLLAIMGFIEVFRDGGIAQVYLNDTDMTPQKERSYAALSLGLGALIGGALALSAGALAAFYGQADLQWALYWAAGAVSQNGI
jgi:O-antigen/teichoic acid export membrane protein